MQGQGEALPIDLVPDLKCPIRHTNFACNSGPITNHQTDTTIEENPSNLFQINNVEGDNEQSEEDKIMREIASIFISIAKETKGKVASRWFSRLKAHASYLNEIFETFQTSAQIREQCLNIKVTKPISSTSHCETIEYNSGARDTVHICNPIDVVKAQMSQVGLDKIFIKAPKNPTRRSHPMNSNICTRFVSVVSRAIKSHSSPSVSWKTFSEHGELSFICLLQVYSDKSVTSLQKTA